MDISVAISDDSFDGFAASWRDWLAAITPTLTARPIGAGSFYALTPSCERFDVIAELMGVVAVQQVQLFLYQLFAESNKPAPPTGPKQWSFKLTGRQRRVLAGLPAAAASPDSVLAAREATFAAFFREAPPIAERNGVPWPSRLEQAVRDYLRDQGAPLPERGPL